MYQQTQNVLNVGDIPSSLSRLCISAALHTECTCRAGSRKRQNSVCRRRFMCTSWAMPCWIWSKVRLWKTLRLPIRLPAQEASWIWKSLRVGFLQGSRKEFWSVVCIVLLPRVVDGASFEEAERQFKKMLLKLTIQQRKSDVPPLSVLDCHKIAPFFTTT